jgi:3-hydroxyisobutyrate dehydrogenase-like beta-hydroxyacid dehydrogenase
MGRAEIDLADEPYSKALTLKVLGNTFILNMIEQLSEGYVAAEKCGLGTGPLLSFIEAIFPGVYVTYSGRMLTGDYHKREEPLFAVDLARKDARHAISLAKSVGVSLPNVETAEAHLSMVREHSGPNGDLAGVYGAVRKEAGLKFENDA